MELKNGQKIYWVRDLARIFNLPKASIKKRFQRGQWSGRKIGTRWVMDREGVEQLLRHQLIK